MDINDLFSSCRKGDLTRIKYLVEQKEVEVNIRDTWDSTPLYYACLCGHLNVVHYLLERGARCEANTFDGERCFYGALTAEIRNLLHHGYQVVTSQTLQRDSYDTFLRRCLEDGNFNDIVFDVDGDYIPAHRCILSVRCKYFAELLRSKWVEKKTVRISHPHVTFVPFYAILQYLYTGRLEVGLDNVEVCISVAKQCRLTNLVRQIEDYIKNALSFQKNKPGTKVTTVVIENNENIAQLQSDFGVLVEKTLPLHLRKRLVGTDLLSNNSTFGDVVLEVEGHRFLCHQLFFCVRSAYFQALFHDHFLEASDFTDDGLRIIYLKEVTLEVFRCVLHYIYQNTTELNPENAYDVLCIADLYLLPGLKRLCGNFIAQNLDSGNVVGVLRTARTYNLPKLEDACTWYISAHLEEVICRPEFHSLILEDAREVRGRQETDSIPVVDDVRFHITNNAQTFSAMADAQKNLDLIEKTLNLLQLDA